MKLVKKNRLLLLVSTLALAGSVSAATIMTELMRFVTYMAQSIMENILLPSIKENLVDLDKYILLTPNIESMKPIMEDIISLLGPLYVVTLTSIGIYILFLSISPGGRAKAKSMFWRMILSMALVAVSFEFYSILLNLSVALSKRMLVGVTSAELPQLLVIKDMNVFAGLLIALQLEAVTRGAWLVMGLRYVLTLLTCALFPLTIFLYFFELTRSIGTQLFRMTLMVIYTQLVQSIMLAITLIIIGTIRTEAGIAGFMNAMLMIVGMGMIVLAPLMMLGLLKWIGGVAAGAGLMLAFYSPNLGAAMVAAGGMTAGMGPSSLMAAGTAKMYGGAYRKSLRSLEPPTQRKTRKGRVTAWAKDKSKDVMVKVNPKPGLERVQNKVSTSSSQVKQKINQRIEPDEATKKQQRQVLEEQTAKNIGISNIENISEEHRTTRPDAPKKPVSKDRAPTPRDEIEAMKNRMEDLPEDLRETGQVAFGKYQNTYTQAYKSAETQSLEHPAKQTTTMGKDGRIKQKPTTHPAMKQDTSVAQNETDETPESKEIISTLDDLDKKLATTEIPEGFEPEEFESIVKEAASAHQHIEKPPESSGEPTPHESTHHPDTHEDPNEHGTSPEEEHETQQSNEPQNTQDTEEKPEDNRTAEEKILGEVDKQHMAMNRFANAKGKSSETNDEGE